MYVIKYTPSGKGVNVAPTGVIPNDVELNTLKSLGVNGRETVLPPGITISIVGETIVMSYTDISATPNVKVL